MSSTGIVYVQDSLFLILIYQVDIDQIEATFGPTKRVRPTDQDGLRRCISDFKRDINSGSWDGLLMFILGHGGVSAASGSEILKLQSLRDGSIYEAPVQSEFLDPFNADRCSGLIGHPQAFLIVSCRLVHARAANEHNYN